MAKKKSFALRIDEDLMEAIEQWAADEFRSANGQIEWILFQMLKQSGRLKSKVQAPENEQEQSNVIHEAEKNINRENDEK